MPTTSNIEFYLKLIESQNIIDGRFTNIRRIDPNGGDGNFSLVFIANDNMSKRGKEIVLKFFNPQRAGEAYRLNCFFREASILKNLKGRRNILPIVKDLTSISIPVGTDTGDLNLNLSFYSSYKAKYSLNDYIYIEMGPYSKNIKLFREVCKAVQRIHNLRICHRDLKPGNFLIFPSGYLCLSDFGSAHDYNSDIQLLSNYESVEVGDPGYRALELRCDLPADERLFFIADFFALGAILFELFTRSVLSDNIFRNDKLKIMIQAIQSLSLRERANTFNQTIGVLVANHPLPSIRKFDPSIPKVIAFEIDKLYKSIAALDYRKRETNFENIFRRINICEKSIKYYLKEEQKKTNKQMKKKGN